MADATERATAALRRAAAHHADPIRLAVIVQDTDGVIVSANEYAAEIIGLPLPVLLGRSGADPRWAILDSTGRLLSWQEHPAKRVLTTGVAVHDVEIGGHRPGLDPMAEHVWVRSTSEPVHCGSGGPPCGVVTAFTEVDPQRARQLRLEESERRFRLIAERSNDMIGLLDRQARHVWVSPAYQRVLGWRWEDLLSLPVEELVHPDDRDRYRAALARTQDLEEVTATVRIRHADGHWVWVEASAHLVDDAATGGPRIVAVSRDVSEREQLLAERDDALNELHALMNDAPIGMAITDAEGYWIRVNSALCDLLRYSPSQLLGLRFSDVTHPDDLDDTTDQFRRMLSGELTTCWSEKRYLRSDGEVVWVQRTASRVVPSGQKDPLFVVQMLDVTERKRAQEVLASQALTDPLTGLPNRLVLVDRLDHALAVARREQSEVAVLFCDLDWFKQINDTLGHDAGDELLRHVGDRIRAAIREEDTAVRLGGDEFVIVCERAGDHHEVRLVAERLREAIEAPYALSGGIGTVSVSIGVAVGNTADPESMLQQADASMYRAKESGRARIDIFDDAAQAAAADRLTLQRDLGEAVARGELRLHYQPIVELSTGRVVAREALVRWQHPVRGLIGPEEFLPGAEHSRRIIEIGEWVLDKACLDAATWDDEAALSVNISARHLATSSFADGVAEILTRTGLPAGRLRLEITESSVLRASPSTLKSVIDLTHRGVRLDLDDFGTGYSSIAALHRLPVSGLKIDRSFIGGVPDNPQAVALVRGLINLARGLGLETVAEGVESDVQARWLSEHACRFVQGYLVGRPVELGSRVPPT